jgi:hypothetical protein
MLAIGFSVTQAHAAPTQYKLTVCGHDPNADRYFGLDPVPVGKIMAIAGDRVFNTLNCANRWYPNNTKVVLTARTRPVELSPRNQFQGAFDGWVERGRFGFLYPKTGSGPKVNACQGIGEERTCLVIMNKHRNAAARFRLVDDPDEYLYEYEEGEAPYCKIIGVSDDNRRVTCTRDGYTFTVDRNGWDGHEFEDLKGDVYYTGLNCTGTAIVSEDNVHSHLYRTQAPGFDPNRPVTPVMDHDDWFEPPPACSGWAKGMGCMTFDEQLTVGALVLRHAPFPRGYGGSAVADRGFGIGPKGQYP